MSKYKANDYKPEKKGHSDKFSWNFYKALKEYSGYQDFKIVRLGWNNVNGHCSLEDGGYFIEISDGAWPVTGNINQIMCRGHKKVIGCCAGWSGSGYSSVERKDVTEWFMREYMRIGRCLIVPEWSHSWVAINKNSRKCRHCGEIQYRTIETIKKIERKERWAK